MDDTREIMSGHALTVVDMGIDTHQEPVVYMREDCHVCRAEGLNASSRVIAQTDKGSVIASLNVVNTSVLPLGHAGFSKVAMQRLRTKSGDQVTIRHAPLLSSLGSVRKKIFGHGLSDTELSDVITDISAHRYSDIEIAGFVTGCAAGRLNLDEIIGLTRAMVACGKHLQWPGHDRIFDKHCIGGLPGNRTTPIVVAIVSAAGLVMPKTSSRAITSPAGTADTLETLCKVNLNIAEIKRVVSDVGACLAWGGAVNLSPADDLLIRIERALDVDGEGQLIASVLSKKIAAGSTHAVIDIPVGDTAKVRSRTHADRLASLFVEVGNACGIQVRCVITDGSKPVGFGIGPVEEARDLMAVLHSDTQAPHDLRERALLLSAHLLDMADEKGLEAGQVFATELLDDGRALAQFERIVEAQGGLKTLPDAAYTHCEYALASGMLTAIDNRKLARLAKLAGAPSSPAAGLRLKAVVGDRLTAGQLLFTLYSDSAGEQAYALDYYRQDSDVFHMEGAA